ncbi:hypothetical protein C8R46DRAFT_242362 [Mycena filopes]|nr:hypothetical protein C8R46DRAFT_242362 [Mycena filopes]
MEHAWGASRPDVETPTIFSRRGYAPQLGSRHISSRRSVYSPTLLLHRAHRPPTLTLGAGGRLPKTAAHPPASRRRTYLPPLTRPRPILPAPGALEAPVSSRLRCPASASPRGFITSIQRGFRQAGIYMDSPRSPRPIVNGNPEMVIVIYLGRWEGFIYHWRSDIRIDRPTHTLFAVHRAAAHWRRSPPRSARPAGSSSHNVLQQPRTIYISLSSTSSHALPSGTSTRIGYNTISPQCPQDVLQRVIGIISAQMNLGARRELGLFSTERSGIERHRCWG